MINKISPFVNLQKISNLKQVSFCAAGMQNDSFERTTDDLSQARERAKDKIIQAIIDTNTEYGVVIAPDGRILQENQGTEGKCSVDARLVEPNSILMHGHPKPLPLSSGDIACLLASDAKSQEAITRDGKFSRLTKKGHWKSPRRYGDLYFELEKRLCLKALDKMGIDYRINKQDLAQIFKDYMNYQSGIDQNSISDEEAFLEMPKYGIEVKDNDFEKPYEQIKEMMWWKIMTEPQKYDKEHNTIMDNYGLINSFLDSDEGFDVRVDFIKDIAKEYDLIYESNL